MKTTLLLTGLAITALAVAQPTSGAKSSAQESAAKPAPPVASVERVGTYDSRAVAFAHFWSDAEQKRRGEKIAEAQAAKKAGDMAAFETRSRALVEDQRRSHLEVFSTAPATEALAALQDRLAAIQQELGVARLVSMWDTDALRAIPENRRVDVTARLVREFKIPPERQKTIDAMRKNDPLPLAEAKRLLDAGRL